MKWTGRRRCAVDLTGLATSSDTPGRIPILIRCVAFGAAVRSVAEFLRSGSRCEFERLGRVRPYRNCSGPDPDRDRFLARELAWEARAVIRTAFGRRLCLAESIGVATALRRTGFPAEIVIGYATSVIAAGSPVHAWVTVGDAVVSDEDGVRHGFSEIVRYPSA